MIIVLFGVSGVGKTTVGTLLAGELGWEFYDADDFHPTENVEKMEAGIPLTDKDRQGWLETLRELIERSLQQNENAVLACSALKGSYRDRLRVNENVHFVLLEADLLTIEDRLISRKGHFMNPALLKSQFETLETPSETEMMVDASLALQQIIVEIKRTMLQRPGESRVR